MRGLDISKINTKDPQFNVKSINFWNTILKDAQNQPVVLNNNMSRCKALENTIPIIPTYYRKDMPSRKNKQVNLKTQGL